MDPQNLTAVSATVSSENLGSTIHATHNSTPSAHGYDSASDVFHGDASSNVPPVQPSSQGTSESIKESEMMQDVTREKDTAMDTTQLN